MYKKKSPIEIIILAYPLCLLSNFLLKSTSFCVIMTQPTKRARERWCVIRRVSKKHSDGVLIQSIRPLMFLVSLSFIYLMSLCQQTLRGLSACIYTERVSSSKDIIRKKHSFKNWHVLVGDQTVRECACVVKYFQIFNFLPLSNSYRNSKKMANSKSFCEYINVFMNDTLTVFQQCYKSLDRLVENAMETSK